MERGYLLVQSDRRATTTTTDCGIRGYPFHVGLDVRYVLSEGKKKRLTIDTEMAIAHSWEESAYSYSRAEQ